MCTSYEFGVTNLIATGLERGLYASQRSSNPLSAKVSVDLSRVETRLCNWQKLRISKNQRQSVMANPNKKIQNQSDAVSIKMENLYISRVITSAGTHSLESAKA